MKATLRQILVVAAGVLAATAFFGAIRNFVPSVDSWTAAAGAAFVAAVVLTIWKPNEEG